VPDPNDRAGLFAVTQILAGLAFPTHRFLDLFGGPEMMIDSPVLDEVKTLIRVRALRESVVVALEARLGPVPADIQAKLSAIADEARLQALHRLAVTCPDLEAFAAGLAGG
jgi:hypothetical protein